MDGCEVQRFTPLPCSIVIENVAAVATGADDAFRPAWSAGTAEGRASSTARRRDDAARRRPHSGRERSGSSPVAARRSACRGSAGRRGTRTAAADHPTTPKPGKAARPSSRPYTAAAESPPRYRPFLRLSPLWQRCEAFSCRKRPQQMAVGEVVRLRGHPNVPRFPRIRPPRCFTALPLWAHAVWKNVVSATTSTFSCDLLLRGHGVLSFRRSVRNPSRVNPHRTRLRRHA